MKALQDHLYAFINQRLDAIVRTPSGWGSPFAVELQYLQVLDFYEAVVGFEGPPPTRGMNQRWSGVLHENGYRGNVPLAQQVEGEVAAFEALQELLPKLRAAVVGSIPV